MIFALASNNKKKLAELADILSGLGITVVPASSLADYPPPDETGLTFAENARIKAAAALAATGVASIADDSGLCVDALGGRPDVHSARYGGDDLDDAGRTALLLAELDGVPRERRTAQFVCAICCALPDGCFIEAEGVCEGYIADRPAGSGGFGYDPVFVVPEYGLTFAELPAGQKNAVSHRGNALRALIEKLKEVI